MQRTEKVIEINAPVERVFDLFSDFESFPRWMSHIKEVRYTGRRYTRWTAEAPLGSSVEWEAETTRFEPDRRIAWRSVRGDIETEGEVIFQETSRGTTLVRVMLGYDPPAGRLGALVARLFGTNPEEQLEEDLERFAEVVEARRRGRLHERAGRGRRAPSYNERAMRSGVGGRGDVEERVRDWEDRDGGYGPRRHERSPGSGLEPERRARFDQELREALGSQRESMRRYAEQRRRDEQRWRREEAERDPRVRDERGPADERRLYERRMRERTPPARRGTESDVDRRPAPERYALTPRERELEREQRRPDTEYSRKAFSRGVDKLLDEDDAPSTRWRRG
ncbi:MAG TPA: SRPBCC family protein [Pyrinomonadaceae bacterium]|jgi:uncharacterized membrane protein